VGFALPCQSAATKLDSRRYRTVMRTLEVLQQNQKLIRKCHRFLFPRGYGSILKVSEVEAKMRESRTRRTKTVCTYCGVGCSFDVWTKDRHILKVEPLDGPTNGISTCVKGKFDWDFVNDKERLTTPLIREGNQFRKASWEEALDLIGTKLGALKKTHGPDSIGSLLRRNAPTRKRI
jgi:formate dehydrogenase major subunit